MYGYIRYCRDEMKIRNLKLYNKYYCLLCTELGSQVGLIYRFLTSYDVTAFMIFFDSLSEKSKEEYLIKCPITKRRNDKINISKPVVDYCLVIALFWTITKIKDNSNDERSCIWKIVNAILNKNERISSILSLDTVSNWVNLLEDYYMAEHDDEATFDKLSNLIGRAYGEVFCHMQRFTM